MQTAHVHSVDELVEAAVRGELSEHAGRTLCRQAPELILLALLAAGKRIAELQTGAGSASPATSSAATSSSTSPSTPSGMAPIYEKPNQHHRHEKPGARDGHPGRRRAAPPTPGD